MSAGVQPEYLYLATAGVCLIGIFIFGAFIPDVIVENNAQTFTEFKENLKSYQHWFHLIWKNCIALMIDMFCVSFFTSWSYYLYDDYDAGVPLWGKNSDLMVNHDTFLQLLTCVLFWRLF
eukprot:UN12171